MKFRIISCVLLAMVLLSACKREGKVIPRGKMAKIYAEMFVADQKVVTEIRLRRMADSSFVYAPIFSKYGYTIDDYQASVEYYLNDADRYARILRHTSSILESEIKELTKERDLMMLQDEKSADHYKPERIFYMTGLDNPDVFQTDSLKFYVDSTGGILWFDAYEWEEKLFRGPEIIFGTPSEDDEGESEDEYEDKE